MRRNLGRLRTEGGEREGNKDCDEKRRVREVGTGLKTSGPIEFLTEEPEIKRGDLKTVPIGKRDFHSSSDIMEITKL